MPPLASLKTGIPYCGETGMLDALPSCLCRLALDSRRRTPIEIGETLLPPPPMADKAALDAAAAAGLLQ